MFKSLAHKLSLREFTLKILKDYYDLNLLLKFQDEKPEIVVNLSKIEFSKSFKAEDYSKMSFKQRTKLGLSRIEWEDY